MFHRTPAYSNYHWVIQGNVDDLFGSGSTDKIKNALLELDVSRGDVHRKILESFQTDKFIETNNGNYAAIEEVARALGLIE